MSEYTELAKECGATLTISQGENGWFNDGGAIFQKEQLTAFAEAIRRKTLEEAAQWFEKHYSSGHVPARYIRKMAQEGVTK